MTKKTKKAIFIYLAVLMALYVVVEILPKVTDIFETTQVLEPGTLTLANETTGYFIKEEQVGIAAETGKLQYLEEEGAAVKKGHKIVSINADSGGEDRKEEKRFGEYTGRLKGFEGISDEYTAPISGVLTFTIDGYEDYFTVDNMMKIKRETVEGLHYESVNLDRAHAIKGEPIYKISNDDSWYILCWVDKKNAESYYEGRSVTIELPEGSIDAVVGNMKRDGEDFRVIFHSDVYYKTFGSSRAEDINIITSDNTGLKINNKCIIDRKGETGVYVKNKNGDYVFNRIKIIASDDKESVIEDATFIDEDGNQVYTVDVYDEVLKHPKSALEKDLKAESEKQGQENGEKEN